MVHNMSNSMFSLGQRLLEKPSIDFSGYSQRAGMYSKLIPVVGKEKNALTNLITKQPVQPPFKFNEYFDDPHLTVIWSKIALGKGDVLGICDFCRRYTACITNVKYWEGHNKVGYIVLSVGSADIQNLHELLLKLGAVHSHNTFEQHITIASNVGALNSEIRNWMGVINEKLRVKPMPLSFTALSFSDLFD